jgi:hypothetical protein
VLRAQKQLSFCILFLEEWLKVFRLQNEDAGVVWPNDVIQRDVARPSNAAAA